MKSTKWPSYGWIGLGLVWISWVLNWALTGLRTHLGFFPLWLGYCLVVDFLALRRTGSSMLTRDPKAYLRLFVISAPVWWLFEILNWRTQNWRYDGREFFTHLEYFLLASLSFSTVMPAVFGTAELVSSFNWLKRMRPFLKIPLTRRLRFSAFLLGCLMLATILIWPRYGFPFLWLSLYFLVEPLNVWLGHRTLAERVAHGDWRPVLALWVGVLICSFFWEMWNFYSYPKWVYEIPIVDFWHVFEMPLLGYGGYLPFSLELYALYQLVLGLTHQDGVKLFLPFAPPADTVTDS